MFLTNMSLLSLMTFNLLLNTLKLIFMNFHPLPSMNSFFLNPADEIEVKNIILSLNSLKATGPNSIPTNVSNYQLMFHLN